MTVVIPVIPVFGLYVFALALSAEQVFDVMSTSVILSKGRGHEGNGLVAKWIGITGRWWWTMKLPVVAAVWLGVFWGPRPWYQAYGLAVMVAFYAWVLWHNYQIAWRKN